MSIIDPVFAKSQLLLLLSDRYQHPNGQVAVLHFDESLLPVHRDPKNLPLTYQTMQFDNCSCKYHDILL